MSHDENDLHRVKFAHEGVHDRLVNWARWCSSGSGTSSTSPMFRLFKAPRYRNAVAELHIPVDGLDGMRLEKTVVMLPELHRDVIRWYYVYSLWGVNMFRACRELGVSPANLPRLVHDARAMVKNRLDRANERGTIAPQFDPAPAVPASRCEA
jgi:hypothetical protein